MRKKTVAALGVLAVILLGTVVLAARASPGVRSATGHSASVRALRTRAATRRPPPPTQHHPTALPGTTGVAPPFVRDEVTAIGDSVMLDYGTDLVHDLPRYHVVVDAAVSRQFGAGIALAQQLRAEGQLGAVVVVALGTNGPVSPAEMSQMIGAVKGAARIVFVTVHVDRPWQAEVNAELRAAAAATPHAVLANWTSLANRHPGWFYSDGTHLPIGGPGAQALATVVSHAVMTATPHRHGTS